MKKTINIHLASLAFQIDEDAYRLLDDYLKKLRERFTETTEQEEILNDIEHRFAELFTDYLGKYKQVVNSTMVASAIQTLGDAEQIDTESEERDNNPVNVASKTIKSKKLFRDPDDKIIAGVLSGLSVYLGFSPVWLRIIFVLLAIASVGVPVGFIYIVLWIVIPKARTNIQKMQMRGEPINLDNITENSKRNITEDELYNSSNIDYITKNILKTGVLILSVIVIIKLLILSIVWFSTTFFINFFSEELIHLFFDSSLSFLLLSIFTFVLLAIPLVLISYILTAIYLERDIAWGKTISITGILGLIVLLGIIFNSLKTAQNYRVEQETAHFIELPFDANTKATKIQFNPSISPGDFEFYIDEQGLKTNGLNYDRNLNSLYINTISFNIKKSEDNTYALVAKGLSRGKNKTEAQEHLSRFSYKIDFTENNTIVIPATLELLNENEFRFQRLEYTFEIPEGAEITFGDNAETYISSVAFKHNQSHQDLNNNTWQMTNQGLVCLTCTEEN